MSVKTKTKKCRVTHRLVDVKRHTKGFVIDGKNCRRDTAVALAKRGRLNKIHVVGNHVQTLPTRKQKLLDLPEKVMPKFG